MGRLNPAKLGNTGSVTFSGGYVANVRSYRLNLNWDVLDSTSMSGSTVANRSFINAGILKWGGEYVARVDDTTALVLPGASAATLTLKVAEDGANDVQLSGSATATRLGAVVRIGQLAEANYSFVGSGDLTSQKGSSTYATFLFADGPVGVPATGSLVLRSHTGRTYTGNAFMSSMTIDVAVDGMIGIEIGFQGTGALTVA